jgi:hypothetical protein|tara:strand:+ start:1165 stop:1452 length:288 start_codon:yes stop_codon:yes gene_type:complete
VYVTEIKLGSSGDSFSMDRHIILSIFLSLGGKNSKETFLRDVAFFILFTFIVFPYTFYMFEKIVAKKKPASKAKQVYVYLAVFIKRPQSEQIGVR